MWNKVKNIEEIIDVFGEPIDFHDAQIEKVKYNGKEAFIEIDCEGFIKTASLYSDKYKNIRNIIVSLTFENVTSFEIDYDNGMNLINEVIIEEIKDKFMVLIDSYYLKLECENINVKKVSVAYEKQSQLLDKFLKSDI